MNWTLATAFHRSPYVMGGNVTRVLALSPHMDMSRVRNWTEFTTIVSGLIQVALLTHRTPVLPDVPCQTEWLHRPNVNPAPTVRDPSKVCEAPLLNGNDPFAYPTPVPYPADERGELIGGWAHGEQSAGAGCDSAQWLLPSVPQR